MMQPRPYQIEAIQRAKESLEKYRSTLCVMATGLGKTNFFTWYADDHIKAELGRVLVLAHREELCEQAFERVREVTDLMVSIEKANNRFSPFSSIVIGSVQTLRGKRLRNFIDNFNPSLIITDEAHRGEARSYQNIYNAAPEAKLLGVTATPKRGDDLALGNTYEDCCFQYHIVDAVRDGWLVDVRPVEVIVEGLDFSNIKTIKGDLSESELENILIEEEQLHAIAKPTVELCGDEPTIVYCATVRHADLMSRIINRYKEERGHYGRSVMIYANTDKDERRKSFQSLRRSGEITCICNVGIATEGVDVPQVRNVVMARPTKSWTLATQIVGRVTRPLPGIVDGIETANNRREAIAMSAKPHGTVIDFVGNSGRHKLITAMDVLGGVDRDEASKELIEAAKAARDDEETVTTAVSKQAIYEEAMKDIRQSLLDIAEERRKYIKAKVQYKTQAVNAYEGVSNTQARNIVENRVGSISQAQLAVLAAYGVDLNYAGQMSVASARKLIGQYRENNADFDGRVWRKFAPAK